MTFAEKIWQVYPEKLSEIAQYLSQDESMRTFYNSPSKEEIIEKLKEPSLKVFDDCGILTYCNHGFDDVHVIDLEFDGVLEKFLEVSIDG